MGEQVFWNDLSRAVEHLSNQNNLRVKFNCQTLNRLQKILGVRKCPAPLTNKPEGKGSISNQSSGSSDRSNHSQSAGNRAPVASINRVRDTPPLPDPVRSLKRRRLLETEATDTDSCAATAGGVSITHAHEQENLEQNLAHLLGSDFNTIRSVNEIAQRLNFICGVMMNRYNMVIAGKLFRLVEVEAYLKCESHKDVFTHGDELQLQTTGHWYFHRQGKTYKGGSYMGLDVTFGSPGKCTGGILIRGVIELETGIITEGPCNVVRKILELTKAKNIVSLVDSEIFTFNAFNGGVLKLEKAKEPRNHQIIRSPRYGLTLKKDAKEREKWLMAPYRFQTAPKLLKKQKNLVSLSIWKSQPGISSEDLKKITGITERNNAKNVEVFKAGLSQKMTEFHGKEFTASLLIQAYGAWSKVYSKLFPLTAVTQPKHVAITEVAPHLLRSESKVLMPSPKELVER